MSRKPLGIERGIVMRHSGIRAVLLLGIGLMGGCATLPDGPSVMVLPGSGKSFEQFQVDDLACRDFALYRIGGVNAQRALDESTAKTAAATALLGAAVGAAADGSHGAGVGAASGALVGTAVGSGVGSGAAWDAQRRYDNAYQQCMYAKGNQVPGVAPRRTRANVPPPPPPYAQSRPVQPSSQSVLQPIYFDLNKSEIRPDAAWTLRRNLEWFRQNPGIRVSVQGNSDPRASEQYNLELGQRRAEAAKSYLVKLGVNPGLLETVSHGQYRPVCRERDESCWARERRVDFVISN